MWRGFVILNVAAFILVSGYSTVFALEQGSPALSEKQAEEIVHKNFQGEVLAQKLDFEGQTPLYEFNVKTVTSEVIEVEIDGNTGAILDVEMADTEE